MDTCKLKQPFSPISVKPFPILDTSCIADCLHWSLIIIIWEDGPSRSCFVKVRCSSKDSCQREHASRNAHHLTFELVTKAAFLLQPWLLASRHLEKMEPLTSQSPFNRLWMGGIEATIGYRNHVYSIFSLLQS